ncbi:MAG: FAD-binding domain-containing protein [Elainellaceae cyanobacterium]
MADLILFWHRRDLRITDNVGLTAARSQSPKVIGVFCLDPHILKAKDVAAARVTYLMGSLAELQDSYDRAGSQLLTLHAPPETAIPALADALKATAVYWNWDVEPYAQHRDEAVCTALKELGIQVHNSWDQLLHAPGEVRTGSGSPYTVYTPFWRNWNRQPKAEPVPALADAQRLSTEEQQLATDAGAIALPTAKDLGFVWENELLLAPGEQAAYERLEAFCEGDRTIAEYDDQRDFPAMPATSRLSAALKFGTIGIRTVWQMADAALSRSRSDETHRNIQTWQQELAWREFYQHCMYFFPELADGPYREPFKDFPWENNEDHFQAWCEGRTGYPIVDAAMRQLNEIGWMHNRCRMIVASFLTKDLIIDWRWGEAYFMQRLYDGDLSANNGGWQWSASSGMDPKPLRIFNPASQAKKYDPEADYIRHWLPELRSLDTEMLVTGNIPEEECDRCDYPRPIVDHKQQQQRFKQIYKAQKG